MEENNEDIWAYDNIRIVDNGRKVLGGAYTKSFNDGYDVQIAVHSYDYERNGETRVNHVPNVVVSDSDGTIVSEPEARDSENPEKAIKNARNTAEYVYEDPERYID